MLNKNQKVDSVSFGKTTAISHSGEMPIADIAHQLGLDIYKTEKGSMLPEELEGTIKKLYADLDHKVQAILKTKPLTDTDPEQYIEIITPQYKEPSIICDAQNDILDATYIHPKTDNVFSFRFVKGELVNVINCSVEDFMKRPLSSLHGQIIDLTKTSEHYKVENKRPV